MSLTPFQVAGVLLGGGLLVTLGVLIHGMHRSRKPDARLLFLWGLMEGCSEETNGDITEAEG